MNRYGSYGSLENFAVSEIAGILGAAAAGVNAGKAISIQDFLAEAVEDEFDAEERGAVVFVEDGIDFDDFEGNHGFDVGDHFHGEVA